MKRIVLLIVVVMLSFFILTNKTMVACPEGFNEATVSMQINNCYYIVKICYICAASTTQTIMLGDYTKVDPNCQQSWTVEQVEHALFTAVTDPTFVYENLCDNIAPPCALPPNPPQGLEEWNKNPVCWYKVRDGNFVWYKPCETCYCVTKWRVCWDPISGMPVETPITEPYLEGEGCECSFMIPPDPISGQTGCFRIPTECEP